MVRSPIASEYLSLFLPAYGVTLVALPLAMIIDHLGRGATLLNALIVIPIWVISAALFSLVFILPAAGLALLLKRLGAALWQPTAGRIAYVLVCAGMGAALLLLTIKSFSTIAFAAGGTAAWLSGAPAWPRRWRTALVVSVGVAFGLVLGIQYY